jgi:hypothetical protein
MRRRCGCGWLMRRRWRRVRRRRRRGRRGRLWRWRGGMRRRRRGLGRGRARRCGLWRFFRLWLSVGTKFLLGLGHNHRRGLGVRRRAYELRRRKSRRGEQHESKFCHDDSQVPGKLLATRFGDQRSVRPDCGGIRKPTCFYFQIYKARYTSVHCVFRRSNARIALFPRGRPREWGRGSGTLQSQEIAAPDAAVGDCGRSGRRTGSSSGVRPGNSSGRCGSPGSCSGGGTSGRGFPGGLSCGGSAGCPGLIGGSSCGSIGIRCFRHFTPIYQRRGTGNVPPLRTARGSAAGQRWIKRKAPGSRRAESARPLLRRADHACEWRYGPTRARRSRRSL